MMRVSLLTFLAATMLSAADPQKIALLEKSQADFEKVRAVAMPVLRDTLACIQTQASLLPVATPEELPVAYYRKGLCELAGATVTQNKPEYATAAADFDKAIESWAGRMQAARKNQIPEALPQVLTVLASVARLESGVDQVVQDAVQQQLALASQSTNCSNSIMTPAFCEEVMHTGHQWLGVLALRKDSLVEAERELAKAVNTGWPEWVAGRKAFRERKYREAAAQYRQGLEAAKRGPAPSLMARMAPHMEIPLHQTELGGAQLLVGDYRDAIATLDAAIKAAPSNARAIYLRARAKELAGQNDAALADYNLASRTAFANAQDLASGEAHLYRGILLFRRKDYSHAEDEFASALNFEIGPTLRAEAVGWRHMAAVAAGSCTTSREFLERALATVSPYFPKEEARAVVAACPSVVTSGVVSGNPPK